MAKPNLKNLVEQIQKLAAPPPKPRTGYVSSGPAKAPPTDKAPPAKTGPRVLPGHGGRGGQSAAVPRGDRPVSNAGIKEMQRKLMNLAKQVTSQIKLEDLAKDMSSPTPVQPSREGVEAAGRNSFGDFIAKNYLRKSDVPGVEFDPSESKKQMSEKQPSTPTRMGVIMDTMSRVGNPKVGEKFDDGEWGPRTNAALRNAYAFAYAMLKLAADFEVPIESYSEQQLKEFKVPAKETDLSVWDRIKLAPTMSQHIDRITQMFNEIKKGILENPQHQTFIEGAPYATYNKAAPKVEEDIKQQAPMLSAQQANEINKIFPMFYIAVNRGGSIEQKPINVTNLVNVGALQAWMKASGVSIPISEIVKQVKQQMEEYWNKLPEDDRLPPKYEDTMSPADKAKLQQGDKKQMQYAAKIGK